MRNTQAGVLETMQLVRAMDRASTPSNQSPLQGRAIALLVDGDNAEPSKFAQILAEAAKHGRLTVRRIYGDWTTPQMSRWKQYLHDSAVQPLQQFRYTTGKNSTDSALIIDAMDLLHSRTVDGFCIASSDSDFTRLATRVREEGLFVMGIGRESTPPAFVNACEVFVYTENLDAVKDRKASKGDGWTELVKIGIAATSRDDGCADLANIGNHVRKLDSAFDSRSFGFSKLSDLIGSRPDLFELGTTTSGDNPPVHYAKLVTDALGGA